MDTKSIKFRYTGFYKGLVIMICLVSLLLIAFSVTKIEYFSDVFENKEFKESEMYQTAYDDIYHMIYNILVVYRNEEYVLAGGSLTDEAIAWEKKEIAPRFQEEIQSIENNYSAWIAEAEHANNKTEVKRLKTEMELRLSTINNSLASALDTVEKTLIQKDLAAFREEKYQLSLLQDYAYRFYNKEGDILSNIRGTSDDEKHFKNYPDVYFFSENSVSHLGSGQSFLVNKADIEGYLAMNENGYSALEYSYQLGQWQGRIGILVLGFGILVFFLSVIEFATIVGNKNGIAGIQISFWDFIHLDIATFSIGGLITLCCYVLVEHVYDFLANEELLLLYYLGGIIVIVGGVLGLYWVRLVSIRIKRGEFFKHTLIYQVFKYLFGGAAQGLIMLKDALVAGSLTRRLIIEGLAYTVLTLLICIFIVAGMPSVIAFVFGLIFLILLNLYAFKKRYPYYKSILVLEVGTRMIGEGDMAYRIDTKGFNVETKALADAIHSIADGFQIAVKNETKSERMKAELVTNVSHDLKTPLTSLITYVDLLKKEEMTSEDAKTYLGIIDLKVERLRVLIEDLFEAAKASSGSMAVVSESMDFAELLTQGLGEISEQINGSGLDFRVNIAEKPLMIYADGKLLWRSIENLITNVFKYSQPESRVYIALESKGKEVIFSIKNISQFELNISSEELTERFKRGDESRNSEGSGLGLSIAKSFTQLMGGSFAIDIDGDLFKVTLKFSHDQHVDDGME